MCIPAFYACSLSTLFLNKKNICEIRNDVNLLCLIHPLRNVLILPGDALPGIYSVLALGLLGFVLVSSELE